MTSGIRAWFGGSRAVDVSLVASGFAIRVRLADQREFCIWTVWRIQERSTSVWPIKEISTSGKILVTRSPSIQGVWRIKIIAEVRTRCS
ncbi:unnamed protein product [Linum trigynum]|uniref:Uncharacterized protein n=1 Tax=Linum trigynum TaxID=586398 RepID=A0AAV2EEP3_9ROSI